MAKENLNVNGLQISDQTRLLAGKAVQVTRLQFYVGDHGPFTIDLEAPNNTPNDQQAAIMQKVRDIRAVATMDY